MSSGCLECCIKCLGGIPYPSLIATILLYAGVALFCGCGHEALSGTVTILQNYFEVVRSPIDALDVFTMWVKTVWLHTLVTYITGKFIKQIWGKEISLFLAHHHQKTDHPSSRIRVCCVDFVTDVLSILPDRIDIIKYVIYGIASAFFVYGILLMVEGFFTSGAIKDLYGDFKITTCGRCVSAWVGLAPHHEFLAPRYFLDCM